MNRQEIIKRLSKYFRVSEIVCDHTYKKFGEQSWMFLSDKLLHTLLVLREDIFNAPISINYGSFTQRGLRCNICQLVVDKTLKGQIYLTQHNGNAVDADIKGFTAEQARQHVIKNQDKLPYPIRLESGVNWLHLDVMDILNGQKITLFNA